MKRLLMLAALVLTSGCATGVSETVSCRAQVVPYSREVQARARQDLALLPRDSPVLRMMDDAAALRAWCRAT